jgi:hypothetical protein
MNTFVKSVLLVKLIFVLSSYSGYSQILQGVGILNKPGLAVSSLVLSDSSSILLPESKPAFSFLLNNKIRNSGEVNAVKKDSLYLQTFDNNLKVTYISSAPSVFGMESEIIFENSGDDTISIANVVPFGENAGSVYITGSGPADLARAFLFRPGFRPVRIILPDNSWESGYSSFFARKEISVCALARRTNTEGGIKQRYQTLLPPKAKVFYTVHTDVFTGEWQNGLRMMFRDRYMYDIKEFDNSLFKREDLAWIKESYLIILQMAWDREFYDRLTGKYTFPDLLRRGLELFGNIDVLGIWTTWPRLGQIGAHV